MLLAVVLLVTRGEVRTILAYWGTIAVARTAGTAIGDWLAGNRVTNIGLPFSTRLTGIMFVMVLLLWRSRPNADLHQTEELH